MPALVLKPGREKSLLRRHPWIFSGAVQGMDEEPASGATLDVLSSQGEFLARGFYSPHSQIRLRVWTFDDEPVDVDFFRRRIRASIHARDAWRLTTGTDALRLIYAESDGLPGLVVDRYAEALGMQSLTTAADLWRETFAAILIEETCWPNSFDGRHGD